MDRTFKPTCVVLFSGGLDSGVLTHDLLNQGETVLGVSAVYGSKHNQFERGAVDKLEQFFANISTGKFPGKFRTVRPDLEPVFMHADGPMFKGGPPLPAAHYNAEEQRATVVPGRNLVLIALAASVAEAYGAGRVFLGNHAGDHNIYPDCRPLFVEAARYAVLNGSGQKVHLATPWLNYSKTAIIKLGLALGFPFHLTRTCYSDKKVACGRCGSCVERRYAFLANGVGDPLEYTCRDEIPAVPRPAGV